MKTFTDGHPLKYLQSPRSDKNGKKKVLLWKRLTVFGPFVWPAVGGDTCSSLAPILGLVKKVTTSPSSKFTARGGEFDAKMCR